MADLSRIHPGQDIVEVEVKGRRAIAHAVERRGRKLVIDPITPAFTWREVTGSQVLRHWRLTKNRRSGDSG